MKNDLLFEVMKEMPELKHSKEGYAFDIMNSEVAEWLCNLPEIRQLVFNVAKDSKAIEYDRDRKVWKGIFR